MGILQAHGEVEWHYYRHTTGTCGSTEALLYAYYRHMWKYSGITIGILEVHVEVQWYYYRRITRTCESIVALL
jgi:hypothetical protein